MNHNDQQIWRSLPGAGKRLAPRLLPAWGDDRTRYADANSVQTLAGTAPVPFQSGAEGKTHSMAVRALANIWVRIIYRMWVNKTCYHTATFEAAQRTHAPRQHVA